MFSKLDRTAYPPKQKPMMVYDGNCGFCKYWVVKWMKITKLSVDYRSFQEVAERYKDIPTEYFRSAVRYIDVDGKIISGPDAAYVAYYTQNKVTFLHQWYVKGKWFMKLSDSAYQWIADHRSFMSKMSVILFGKDPNQPKAYWKIYFLAFVLIITSLLY